jgi:hypothetical protein
MGIPLLILGGIVASFGDTPTAWRIVLMITIVYGYTHFIVGGYFQLRGFARRKKPLREYTVFGVLVLCSLLIVSMFYLTNTMMFFGVMLILYFVLHGYMNEGTLFLRQTGLQPPHSIFAFFALWFGGVSMFALMHPSAFFTATFEFLSPGLVLYYRDILFGQFFSIMQGVGWAALVLGYGILLASYRSTPYKKATSIVLLGSIPLTAWVILSGPLPYMYLYYFLLAYHFTSWMMLYGIQFVKEKSSNRLPFFALHGAIILLFVIPLLPAFELDAVALMLFNFYIHITFSMLHNTTSLMNEVWFRNLLDRVWPV